MAIFSARNTRLVTVLSFLGALLYYQSAQQLPPHKDNTQITEEEYEEKEKVSSDELSFTLPKLPLVNEEISKNKWPELPASPPPPWTRQASEKADPPHKSARNSAVSKYLPVLQPSNGSFLDTLDISGFTKKERMFLNRRLEVLRQRAKLLSNKCKSRPHLAQPGSLHLVWDTKHTPNVVWCPNYKVASTTWMVNFLRLAHFNDDNPDLLKLPKKVMEAKKYKHKYAGQDRVYELYPAPSNIDERDRVFSNSLRMIMVRHPFSRLISAYRDKMLKMDPKPRGHKFRELQIEIIKKYRKKKKKSSSPFPTFPEFVQYVIDSTKTLKTFTEWRHAVKCWLPYWAQCNVCAADFNLVMKLETMAEDEKFLTTLTDMTELKELKTQEWRHLRNGTSSNDLMREYMGQLTKRQAFTLVQRYHLDYILFGYSETDLLDYTNY